MISNHIVILIPDNSLYLFSVIFFEMIIIYFCGLYTDLELIELWELGEEEIEDFVFV
jgi:hypothetical protein